MSLKGLFTNGEENDAIKSRLAELEKNIRKINTLDVHIKRFLQWERDLAPLLKKKEPGGPSANPVKERKAGEGKESEKAIRQLVARELQPFFAELRRLNGLIDNLAQERNERKREIPKRVKLARENPARNEARETAELLLKIEQMGLLMAEMQGVMVNQSRRILELEEAEKQRLKSDLAKEKTASAVQPPPVIYQEYKIEKVIVDKYELNNTIGQLGIKELGGQLNIGATYGVNRPPEMGGMGALVKDECPENMDPGTEEESGESS
ncbi:hypothetical protein DRW41_01500 [Neobacillus piezotolerans]|uniref:Uncharacterized protein n=1 Tax=Neobacillus piezotolerans TaxID=2259171 RepID=A0A3D8GV85_9BACI|nr:hypothetical protein [Neobacillus piezotolerans]RDU38272.1 hypothetical protein DRW41_01500 [Neobacillus piezotolerans]